MNLQQCRMRGMKKSSSTLKKCNVKGYNDYVAPLKQIASTLTKFANTSLAAFWNVKLLVEPTEPKSVSHILLTNDLTEDVMDEAIELQTDLIITHHPLIFDLLTSITTESWQQRIIARCLENKIAVFSLHSSLDFARNGVNDWLTECFELEYNMPIEQFLTYGLGRFCILKDRISVDRAVDLVKQQTNLTHVRLAHGRGTYGYIKKIALCVGVDVSMLEKVSADLYLTEEMPHHNVLDTIHQGNHVILINYLECGLLKMYASKLKHSFQNPVEVCVSKSDKDLLQIV